MTLSTLYPGKPVSIFDVFLVHDRVLITLHRILTQMIVFLIVNFKSSEMIVNLLDNSIFRGELIRVIIVNNSPEDDNLLSLKRIYSNINIIESGQNLGFGKGCNLGLRFIYQKYLNSYVWLINPDTLLDLDAVAYVRSCFRMNSNLAILGTGIRDHNGNSWFDQGDFNRYFGSFTHTRSHNHHNQNSVAIDHRNAGVIPSRWVSGCSMILDLHKFDHCPEFDPVFFLYYEDNDFCERYYQQGYSIAVTETALVTHAVSSISNQNLPFKWHHATFSKLYFLHKHATFLAIILNFLLIYLKIIVDGLTGNFAVAMGRWNGLQQFLRFCKNKGLAHDSR